MDPLAEKYPSWTPYHYVHNNPINMIDPTGMEAEWIPDNDGNLIAEKGDNTRTLAKYLGRTVDDVGKSFKINGKSIGNDYEFKEGQKAKPDNNVTRAIKNSNGVTTTERLNGSNKSISPSTDNYICDECAQMATHGEEITPKNASKYGQFPNPMSFDSTPGFTQVESFEGVAFNKGIASIGGQHTVSYYGTSNNGTVYVLSKDGRSFKPQVYSLQQTINLYNQVEGTKFTMEDVRYYKKDK